MLQSLRAADVLARRLYDAGCRHAFGMPGGEVLTLIDALEKAGIRFVLTKHENAAGFMAEGVHHLDGAPAILVATVGPGAMNGVNVIANAQQDRVPLIVLTGCVDAAEAETYTHQVLDHRRVLEPITKATFTLNAPAAGIIADKAVGIATEGRAGPVHIDVPIAVAEQTAQPMNGSRAPASPVAPTGADLRTARDWLAQAKRPVMLAGLDVLKDGAAADVQQFAETFGVPVMTTYKAKGIIPEDHPLALGGAGLSPLADRHLLPFVAEADLIILVGYDPIEMRTGWQSAWDPVQQNVIDIHAAPNHHYMHQATLSFIADTGAALNCLSAGTAPQATWAEGQVPALKSALAAAFPTDEPWGPGAVIDTCRNVMPPETIATVDSGAHRIMLSQMWTCPAPRKLLQSSGLCTMGCAVPLAIGAKIAAPDQPVISFSGDAGLLMVAGELATAAELGQNTIFVVFVDASLALIELKQRQRQMDNRGVDFVHHDYAAVAQAFGGNGVTVSDRTELTAALQDALNADSFTLIAAKIAQQSYDGRI
ncbi:thiamine pyrophosphate-binding protein [Yoonia sediminilitoris]|uniref:Acetolactate synthase-1/2/3 large subunit n=1 Tax=Yoonia sediminilitoris TaxID=1286148 RepID=A0A2T6KJV6_9RHOB|nr:thiamine pyrophosphate-binding protein [Yoonia sediminilitoris]PUB16248.1 acetolactate synthase-1/2/3 large subunit [Yoonia sediminilitoris]RCW96597.1 acetolactate synthase-1/2/3 large subunit [Yoonia sediminilitoris]